MGKQPFGTIIMHIFEINSNDHRLFIEVGLRYSFIFQLQKYRLVLGIHTEYLVEMKPWFCKRYRSVYRTLTHMEACIHQCFMKHPQTFILSVT